MDNRCGASIDFSDGKKETKWRRTTSDMFPFNLLPSGALNQAARLIHKARPYLSKIKAHRLLLTFSALCTPKIAPSSGFSRQTWKALPAPGALSNDCWYVACMQHNFSPAVLVNRAEWQSERLQLRGDYWAKANMLIRVKVQSYR